MKHHVLTGLVGTLLLAVCGPSALGKSPRAQQQQPSKQTSTSSQTPKQTSKRTSALFTQTSVEKAWQQAVAQQRPLLVMFTTDDCRFCKKMIAKTYGDPAVERLLRQNTVTVLAHSDDYRALVKEMGVRGYPSSVLVSPKGVVLDFMQGYVDAKKFTQRVTPLLLPTRSVPSTASIASKSTER